MEQDDARFYAVVVVVRASSETGAASQVHVERAVYVGYPWRITPDRAVGAEPFDTVDAIHQHPHADF